MASTWGLCAEFPSLSWLAPTPAKALAGVRTVVAECVRATAGTPAGQPQASKWVLNEQSKQ